MSQLFSRRLPTLAFSLLVTGLLALPAIAADSKGEAKKVDDYPLDVCVVSGEKLGSMGEPFIYKHEGREIRFCCNGCVKDFKKDPEKYLKKLDEAAIAKQRETYPLDTCVVSGEKLEGEMGGPYDFLHQGKLVRLCCKHCLKDFKKDPAKYIGKIEEARKKELAPKAEPKAEEPQGGARKE